jgi:hypothetical protein
MDYLYDINFQSNSEFCKIHIRYNKLKYYFRPSVSSQLFGFSPCIFFLANLSLNVQIFFILFPEVKIRRKICKFSADFSFKD